MFFFVISRKHTHTFVFLEVTHHFFSFLSVNVEHVSVNISVFIFLNIINDNFAPRSSILSPRVWLILIFRLFIFLNIINIKYKPARIHYQLVF